MNFLKFYSPALYEQRGALFNNLLSVIKQMFISEHILKPLYSTFFLFTKMEDGEDENTVLSEIVEIYEATKQKFKKKQTEELMDRLDMLGVIIQKMENIIVVNPCDKGASAARMKSLFLKAEPIKKEYFDFIGGYQTKRAMIEIVSEISQNANERYANIFNGPKDIDELKNEISQTENSINIAEGLINSFTNQLSNSKEDFNIVNDLKSEKIALQNQINNEQDKLSKFIKKKQEMETEVLNLNLDAETKEHVKHYYEHDTYGTVKRGVRKTSQFSYTGNPIQSHCFSYRHGSDEWLNDDIWEYSKGKISFIYTGPSNYYGGYDLYFYIKNKDKSEIQRRYSDLKSQLESNKLQIDNTNFVLKQYELQLNKLNTDISNAKNDAKNKLEELKRKTEIKIEDKKKDIANFESHIKKCSEDIEIFKKLIDASIKYLDTENKKLEMVLKIDQHINLGTVIGLKEFKDYNLKYSSFN